MTREERNIKLKHLITCMKCEVSGKVCDENCPTQYEAGNMGEIIENLEAISETMEQQPCEDWYDVPSNEMTFEQARQAVKDLRKKLAEYLEQEPCEDTKEEIWKDIPEMENTLNNNPVSRQAVKDIICSGASIDTDADKEYVCELIDKLPSVTPKEKTGKWIDDANKIDAQFGRHTYICSECGKYAEYFVSGTEVWWDRIKPNFCPNCGAKMEGDTDGKDNN